MPGWAWFLIDWFVLACLVAIPLGRLLKQSRLERERLGERPLTPEEEEERNG